MLGVVEGVAQLIGYVVLSLVAMLILGSIAWNRTVSSEVSDEAKQLAKETDPNNPVEAEAAEVIFDSILEEARELRAGETIRAEPEPLTHFDWSVDDARQEDIEHILATLQAAGYYTHPLPDVDTYRDEGKWSRERAGVWRSEPDWYIVEFDEDGSRERREQVDLPLPDEWQPA